MDRLLQRACIGCRWLTRCRRLMETSAKPSPSVVVNATVARATKLAARFVRQRICWLNQLFGRSLLGSLSPLGELAHRVFSAARPEVAAHRSTPASAPLPLSRSINSSIALRRYRTRVPTRTACSWPLFSSLITERSLRPNSFAASWRGTSNGVVVMCNPQKQKERAATKLLVAYPLMAVQLIVLGPVYREARSRQVVRRPDVSTTIHNMSSSTLDAVSTLDSC